MNRRIRSTENSRNREDERSRSVGETLPAAFRMALEPRFGHSFGDVRVHSDDAAARAARELHADAFTLGRDVYFAEDQYAPQSDAGARLLAHELAHVVQGSRHPPRPTVSDASDPAERDAWSAADRAISVPTEGAVDVGNSAPAAVARSEEGGKKEEDSIFSVLGGLTELPGKVFGGIESLEHGLGKIEPVSSILGTAGGVSKAITAEDDAARGSGLLGAIGGASGLTKSVVNWLGGDAAKPIGAGFGAGGSFLGAGASAVDAVSDFSKGNYGKGSFDVVKSLGSLLSGAGELGGFSVAGAGELGAGAALTGSETAAGVGGLATGLGSAGAVLGAGVAGWETGTLLNEHTSVGKHTEESLDTLDWALNGLTKLETGKTPEGSWADRKTQQMTDDFKKFDVLGGIADAAQLGGFGVAGALGGLGGGLMDAQQFTLGGGWQNSLNGWVNKQFGW